VSLPLYLFDDRVARGWEPFALTRPVGELLFGALLLRERIERALGSPARAYLRTGGLADFEEAEVPPVVDADSHYPGAADTGALLLSTRYVPPLPVPGEAAGIREILGDLEKSGGVPPGGLALQVEGVLVGWLLPIGAMFPSEAELLDASPRAPGSDSEAEPEPGSTGRDPAIELPGEVLENPWQLLDRHPDRLLRDLTGPEVRQVVPDARPLGDLPGVHRVGPHPVTVEEGVEVGPQVVLDTRAGPIHLAPDSRLHPFTLLRGPARIGRGSELLGGSFETLVCGPVCKLRGEISSSIVLGYSNKAHDGFLGHSILGRWVNLGAFTTNSNLKNNYGTIRIGTAEGEQETGLLKLGMFLGDHVKTGIGTLVNGGTSVGAGTNLFGSQPPPKWVAPFRWGGGDGLRPHRLEPFLRTAEAAMGRRGVTLTDGHRRFLSRAWERAHGTPEGAEPEPRDTGGTGDS